jgi:Transposase DDE domain
VAEFAHAWIKERCGLRQFRCRGRLKATMEATWACLTYNLMRWFGLRRTQVDGWPGLSVMRRVPRPRFLRAGLGFGFSLVDHQIHQK